MSQKQKLTPSQKIIGIVLFVTVGRVNKCYLLYKNMYSIQRKMNIFKSFWFSLAKKGSRSRPKKIGSSSNFKSAQAPAKKPRLRPATAPQHRSEWRIYVLNLTHFDSFLSNIHMFESIRIGNKDPDQYKAPEYTDPIRIHSSETYVLAHLQKLDA